MCTSTTLLSSIDWIIVGLILWLALLLVRNNVTCTIRIHVIYDDWPKRYNKLPSYDAMLFNPRYWGMWTQKQWDSWIDKQLIK